MSILDTFYILFKSDASDVKKGADIAEKSTKNLAQSLKSVDKESNQVGKSFLDMAQSALGFFGSIASIGGFISSFHNAISSVTDLGNVSRELNVNITTLDAWGHAVKQAGGTAEAFQSSVKGLAERFGAQPETILRLLPRLSDQFAKLNQYQANRLGKFLGLDQGTIYLLQQGRREVEAVLAQQQKLGLVTKEQDEVTKKFNRSLDNLGHVYDTLAREFALPVAVGLSKAFDYLVDHQDLIVGALGVIGLAVAGFGLKFAAANPQIALFAASIAAIAVAYEDVKGFVQGGKDTALGDLFGVGSGGLKVLRENIKAKTDTLPDWAQKLIGTKVPDYAKNNTDNYFKGIPGLSAQGLNQVDNSKKTTVSINSVEIQTQATNADEIAGSMRNELQNQLAQVNSQFDNGVHA